MLVERIDLDGHDTVGITVSAQEDQWLDHCARVKTLNLKQTFGGLVLRRTSLALRIALNQAQWGPAKSPQHDLARELLASDLKRFGMQYSVIQRAELRIYGVRVLPARIIHRKSIPLIHPA